MTANVAPVVASKVEAVAGVSVKKVWKYEIVDEKLIPREYLIPDTVKIGKMVRAGGDTLQIPGVRIYAESNLSIGG